MRTVTYKSVLDRIAGYMSEADGLSREDAALANVKINLLVRLAWEFYWWPELMLIEPRELDTRTGRVLGYDAPHEKRKGLLRLESGVSSGSVTGCGLEFQPLGFRCQVLRAYGGLNLRAYPVTGSCGPDGFQFELSGETDSAEYYLAWEAWGEEEGLVPAEDSDTTRAVGLVSIANESQSGTVSGLDLGFTPTVGRCQVIRPAGALNLEGYFTALSSDGFSYELSGLTDGDDYALLYELAEEGQALGPMRVRGRSLLRNKMGRVRVRGQNAGYAPRWVSAQVYRPGGLNVQAYPVPATFERDGFEVELDGVLDSDAYELHWEAGLPPATALGEIRAIWDRDPRGNRYACRVGGGRGPDFRLRGGEVTVLGCANPVWVEQRRRPNVYTGPVRSASASYAAGDQVYDPASGDYWLALEAVNPGETPVTHAYKWERVEFPYVLAEFVAQSAYGMLVGREEQEPENFTVQMAAGWPLLQAELDKIERQQGQTTQLRVATGRG